MPSKLRVRTLRRMLITWTGFNVWLPEWLKAVGVCPTRSDLKSWICFRTHVEDWVVIWSLRSTYPTAPWIYPLRNSSLGHSFQAFEDITWNCIIGVSGWTEGRPPSPFGSLGPRTSASLCCGIAICWCPQVETGRMLGWDVSRRQLVFHHPVSPQFMTLKCFSAIFAFHNQCNWIE